MNKAKRELVSQTYGTNPVFKGASHARYFETEMGEMNKREMNKAIKDCRINSEIAKLNSPTFRHSDPIVQGSPKFDNAFRSSIKTTLDSYKTNTSLSGFPNDTQSWKPCCKLVEQGEKAEKPQRRELKGCNTMKKYERDPITEGDAKRTLTASSPKAEFVFINL